MIEQDLRTYLLAQPSVTALIATRLYPIRLPQGVTLPAVTYQRITGSSEQAYDGPVNLGQGTIQFDCWADTYASALAVAEQVRQKLAAIGHRITNLIDFPESEPAMWRRMVEVSAWHREDV